MVYQGANNFGAYHGTEIQPKLNLTWFLAAAHQLRFSIQWAAVRADERGFYAVPAGDGELVPATRTRESHDINISQLTMQLRYRWEIAPLTDLYVVYNRGNSLLSDESEPFADMFSNAFEDPVIDTAIIKLRYRFAN